MDYFRELADKLFGNVGSMPAGDIENTVYFDPNAIISYPGQTIPVTVPGQYTYYGPRSNAVLSDFDIELMAACISNKHPVVDGQSHCFCTLKRLERGISKD